MSVQTDHLTTYDRADVSLLIRLTEWRGRALLRSILFLLVLFALALFIVIGQPDSAAQFVILAMLGGLIGGWLLLMVPQTGSRFALHRMRRNGQLLDQAFEVADEAFVIRNHKGESRYKWAAIRSVEQVQDRLFLFVTDKCAVIVPGRAFTDEARFRTFVDETVARWRAARA